MLYISTAYYTIDIRKSKDFIIAPVVIPHTSDSRDYLSKSLSFFRVATFSRSALYALLSFLAFASCSLIDGFRFGAFSTVGIFDTGFGAGVFATLFTDLTGFGLSTSGFGNRKAVFGGKRDNFFDRCVNRLHFL